MIDSVVKLNNVEIDNLTLFYLQFNRTQSNNSLFSGMSSACYTYVSEISPPSKRGIFNSLGPISASTGILVTYVLGYLFPWWMVAYISCAFSVFTCISMHFMPESPPYLAKQDRKQESLDSLMWLRRSNAIAQAEFENYKTSPEDTGEDMSFKEKFLVPTTIKPFLILMGLFFLQESSGIYIILFYAVNFLQDANLSIDESLASITIGIMRLTISIFAAFLINRFGRKTLCIVSAAGMAASMLATGIYSKYYEMYPDEVKILPLLPLICVLLNVFFCMIGMVPVPWIMTGELFPLRVRSIMAGVVMCMAQLFIFTSVKIYPDLQANLNFSGTVLLFFIASIISIFYAKYLLPETKNKRLEEIEEYFKSKKSKNLCGVDNQAFVIKPEVIDSEKGNKNFYSIDIASTADKTEGKQ